MTALHDSLGLAISGANAAALRAYEQGIDAQLHAWPGAEAALRQALQHAPGFDLAHAALALVLQSQGRGAEARAAIVAAREPMANGTDRERSHITLLAHAIEGRPAQALAAVLQHAQHWPRDALAVSIALGAFGLMAFSGRADHDQARLDFVRQLVPHYPADHAWALTHLSWAHTEAGLPEQGLEMIERSLALRRANGNAAHVKAHALFELTQAQAALHFIDGWLPIYPVESVLYGHLNWHAALSQIDLGQADTAVSRWLALILPHLQHALPLVGVTDAASLLWRLKLQGHAGLSWRETQAYAAQRFPQGGNPFVELHLAMLAAERGDLPALAQGHNRMQALAQAGHGGGPVLMAWIEGLRAMLQGDRAAAGQALANCHAQAVRIGGSHAQRTVIDLTLAPLTAARPHTP